MYVGGRVLNGDTYASGPAIWKNGGQPTILGPGNDKRWDDASVVDFWDGVTSVFVDGEDVYATSNYRGEFQDEYGNNTTWGSAAVLWKNGAETFPGGRHSWSGARSVAVLNGDVYVAGWAMDQERERKVAVLWVNGARYDLIDQAQGPFVESFANSVAVRERANPAPIAR
jgi:hypothetical protein